MSKWSAGAWLAAAIAAAPPAAHAQDEAAAREAEMFGGDDEASAREAAMFSGGDDSSDREAAMFAGDDDASAREDEMFGASDDGSEAPAGEPVRPPVGSGLLSSGEIDRRLGGAQNKLDIGGLMYLRASYAAYEDQLAEQAPLSSPNLFDLYLDARPNDHLRVFTRGRVTHHFAAPSAGLVPGLGAASSRQTDFALDQLWLKFDVEDTLFVTVGRQPIKWGASRFWNPTDFLNRSTRDPLAVFDERLGVGAVKLHLPVESSGWNLYAIADFDDASTVNQVGGAFRIEKLVGDTELSVSTALRKDEPLRLGADVSFPLWVFDLRAEAAVVHGDDRTFFRGAPDWERPETLARVSRISRDDEWIPQAVLGAEIGIPYGDDDSITVGAEYFYNGAGYDDPRIYPLLLATGGFTPLYLGQHYGGLYATAIGPGRWNDTTLIASVLGNMSDRSFLGRFDYRVRLLTYLDVNTFVAYHFGDPGEFRLGMELPAVQLGEAQWDQLGVPPSTRALLASGVDVNPPTVELGAGLQLRF